MQMKRIIVCVAAMCLAVMAVAQKPKRMFSTEKPPFAGVTWQDGEQISLPDIDNPEGVLYTVENVGDKTYFSGRGACRAEDGRWVAIYPASALRMWDSEFLYFNIPHEQVANATDMPLFNRTDVVEFNFKPLTAYVSFTLAPDAPPVKEVRLSTNKYISGSYKVELAQKSLNVLLDTGERFRDIVLKPQEEGGVIAPGDYTMCIYARTLPEGMTVEAVAEDGSVAVKQITSEVKFTLGKTRDLGVISRAHFAVPSDEDADPVTDAGKILEGDQCPKVTNVLWDTTYVVTPGMDYYQMRIVTDAGEKMDMYLIRADLSKGLDLRAAISDETTSSKWLRQNPSAMAAHMDSPECPVYAAINADFCDNREPIRPRGPIHCNGKVWASSYSIDPRLPQQALSYVGVDYDGKVSIAPSAEYESASKSLKECSGAGVILLMDSQIQGGYVNGSSRDPRTALGYTSENVLWILAVDGRHKGTEGMTYLEMASIFQALGCVAAVNLDGGGSTQMLVRNPQTDEIDMCNWPSDPHAGFGGRERPRLNSWLIMKGQD